MYYSKYVLPLSKQQNKTDMKKLIFTLIALSVMTAAIAQTNYVPKAGDTVYVYHHGYVLGRDTIRRGAHLWYAVNELGRYAWLDQRVFTK